MKAYLAGPDVFLPHAVAHAAAKIAICARYGIIGRAPVGDEIGDLSGLTADAAWRAIYQKDIAMMGDCDIIIANLTPFRGASADAGTLVELGWFLGRGKPVFGYSNTAALFGARSRAQVAKMPDPVNGLMIEDFGLPDNLMIAGATSYPEGLGVIVPPDGTDRAFDALDIFEICVAQATQVKSKSV
ncbi:MAG: nucleoside 2-deoxyribosyltransferase [Acidocella sp. 20-57-95]|nr:MAG: nucleoside 2-deoxyribosyltransferase [Acidocella sp. 20-57-95]HQT63475.1 nucleoside 2-deoxyribosyltransferase [Acidocella sp.]HQU05398.1 nucleoside 2-deoxyribosyltransferase [Acidocella sp.]